MGSRKKVDRNGFKRSPWRWPLVVSLALSLLAVGYRYILDRAASEAREWRERAIEVASVGFDKATELTPVDPFSQGVITKTFISSMPKVEGADGGKLELATAELVETFEVEDQLRIAWDLINLGTTTAAIRVPVTYRYHIELSHDWYLTRSDHVCVVFAPSFRPSQPPAIHTEKMVKRVNRGWARLNAKDRLNDLEQSLTPKLRLMAADQKHRDFVTEECRRSVANFVREWLLREDQWQEDRFTAIKVIFPDEVSRLSALSEALTLGGAEE